MPNFLFGLLNAVQVIEILWFKNLNSCSLWGKEHSILKMLLLNQKYIYEILIGSCERQRFPAQASRQVRGLFILGLGIKAIAYFWLTRGNPTRVQSHWPKRLFA